MGETAEVATGMQHLVSILKHLKDFRPIGDSLACIARYCKILQNGSRYCKILQVGKGELTFTILHMFTILHLEFGLKRLAKRKQRLCQIQGSIKTPVTRSASSKLRSKAGSKERRNVSQPQRVQTQSKAPLWKNIQHPSD